MSPRNRSLITVSSLITGGDTDQLAFHLSKAKEKGPTEELAVPITHLAIYAGWQKGISAIMVAKKVFSKERKINYLHSSTKK